jgi:hypothetical protein
MEKFTLAAVKKGKTLVTRDCKEVRFIAYNQDAPAPVIVEVLMNADDKDELGKDWQPHWQLENYYEDGSYLGFVSDDMDLFVSALPDKKIIGKKQKPDATQLSIN